MFRILLNYIVYTNIIVSISAAILCEGIIHRLGITSDFSYGIFIFFATLFVYNFQRLVKSHQTKSIWIDWVKQHKQLVVGISIASFLLANYWLFTKITLSIQSFILIGISGLISVFYVFKLKQRNLRELPYLKIHLISAVWCALVLVFPMENENSLSGNIGFIILHYFYIVAITIPFDIRDLKHDQSYQKTIPQVLGVRQSKLLGVFLLFLFFYGMLFLDIALMYNPLFYLAVFSQIILIVYMNENRNDIYCAGLIDGSIALLGLSYCLF